jgi:hypothetical protein
VQHNGTRERSTSLHRPAHLVAAGSAPRHLATTFLATLAAAVFCTINSWAAAASAAAASAAPLPAAALAFGPPSAAAGATCRQASPIPLLTEMLV